MGHFERCITLWMYALDMQQKILEPLSPMTQSSLLSFAELFSFMMSDGGYYTLTILKKYISLQSQPSIFLKLIRLVTDLFLTIRVK